MAVYAVRKYWDFPPKTIYIIAFSDKKSMEESIAAWYQAREDRIKNSTRDRIEAAFKSSFAPCTGMPPLYARPTVGQERRLKHADEHLVS